MRTFNALKYEIYNAALQPSYVHKCWLLIQWLTLLLLAGSGWQFEYQQRDYCWCSVTISKLVICGESIEEFEIKAGLP